MHQWEKVGQVRRKHFTSLLPHRTALNIQNCPMPDTKITFLMTLLLPHPPRSTPVDLQHFFAGSSCQSNEHILRISVPCRWPAFILPLVEWHLPGSPQEWVDSRAKPHTAAWARCSCRPRFTQHCLHGQCSANTPRVFSCCSHLFHWGGTSFAV